MAIILKDFRIFRKRITKIGDIFFSQKIGATLYQSKPVISSTPSLNVDRNCHFFIQPVGRASSLSCKTMMRLFPRAGWNWRLQWGLQVDLLGGGAPLGLSDHLPAAPPQCPPRLWQPSAQGAQSAVRTRMRRRRTLKMWFDIDNLPWRRSMVPIDSGRVQVLTIYDKLSHGLSPNT